SIRLRVPVTDREIAVAQLQNVPGTTQGQVGFDRNVVTDVNIIQDGIDPGSPGLNTDEVMTLGFDASSADSSRTHDFSTPRDFGVQVVPTFITNAGRRGFVLVNPR
ncbi:MAG: hypothetical protein UY05_C0042G0006, partial [Candidatus Peregrinibacteria bacterium GW2011_GWA2_47_7]